MDKPVQGTGLPPSAKMVRQGTVPEVAKVVNQPGAAVAQNADQKRTEHGDKVGPDTLPQIATLESMLPIAILKSPVLMQTEWAWRRLLVALTQSGPAAAHAGNTSVQTNVHTEAPHPTTDNRITGDWHPVQPSTPPLSSTSAPSITTPVRSREMLTTSLGSPNEPDTEVAHIETPIHEGDVDQTSRSDPHPEMPVNEFVSMADDAHLYTASREASSNQGLAGEQAPPSPLKELTIRAFTRSSADEHAGLPQTRVDQPASGIQAPSLPIAETALKALWTTLSSLAGTRRATDWITHLPASFHPESLISFTEIKLHHLTSEVPEQVKEWAKADRLVSATRTPDAPQTGGGVFVLPAPLNEQRMNTVRWQAERRTRTSNQGQTVHQLTLELRLDNFPLKIQLLCAKPSVAVRVETNHLSLRQALEQRQETIKVGLNGLGWRLDRWTVGTLEAPEEGER